MPHAWTDTDLDQLRLCGDSDADAAILPLQAERAALSNYLSDAGPAPEALQPWLATARLLPPWAEMDRIRCGQAVFGRYAIQAMIALLCKGLPECYAGAKGATILSLSGRIAQKTRTRIMETARFLLSVTEVGALEPGGKGIEDAIKVRLVHSIARGYLLKHSGYHPSLGAAINHEDQLGTLMAFSGLVLEGLPRLGVRLSTEEAGDYFHVWQVVGYLLGLPEAWIPSDPEDGRALFAQIRRRQHAPSEAGRALNDALLEMLIQLIPGTFADHLPAMLMRHLLAEKVADILEVPKAEDPLVLHFLHKFGEKTERLSNSASRDLWEPIGRGVFKAIYLYGQQGQKPTFHAPH